MMHPAVLVTFLSFLLLFCLFSLFFATHRKQFLGMLEWGLAFFFLFSGMLLFFIRDFISIYLSIVSANFFIIASIILFNRGFRKFLGLPLGKSYTSYQIILFVAFEVFHLYFTFVSFWYEMRIVIFSFFHLIYFAESILIFTKKNLLLNQKQFQKVQWFYAFMFLLALIRMVNTLIIIFQHRTINKTCFLETLYFVLVLSASVFQGFMLMLVMNQKLIGNLREEKRKKDLLFSLISHDIRSPIHSLLQMNEILCDSHTMTESEWKEYLELYQKTLKKTASLTDALLTWAMQERESKLEITQISLYELISHNLALVSEKIKEKHLNIEIQVSREIEATTNLNILDTAIRNILSNAVKFTSSGGTIQFRAIKEDKETRLWIQDSGIGMTPEKMKEIFEIRHKHSVSGTHGESGSGIGLALSHDLFRRIFGTLTVESQVEKGSCFSLYFPDLALIAVNPEAETYFSTNENLEK